MEIVRSLWVGRQSWARRVLKHIRRYVVIWFGEGKGVIHCLVVTGDNTLPYRAPSPGSRIPPMHSCFPLHNFLETDVVLEAEAVTLCPLFMLRVCQGY